MIYSTLGSQATITPPATFGHPRHIAELYDDWTRRRLLYVDLDSLTLHFTREVNVSELGTVSEILNSAFARLFPTTNAGERFTRQCQLAVAALQGEYFTAQASAAVLEQEQDAWQDWLDDALVRSATNPDGLLDEPRALPIVDGVGEVRHTLWLYRFLSDLQRRSLVAFCLSDHERKSASATLGHSLIHWHAPQLKAIAPILVDLFTLAGESGRANHYRQIAKEHLALPLAQASTNDLLALPIETFSEEGW